MTGAIEWQPLITAGLTLLSIIIAGAAYARNSKNDTQDGGEKTGTMLSDIGYIKAGVDDIKKRQNEQDKTTMEVLQRLTSVEASAKQAHKRLDRIEGKEDRGGPDNTKTEDLK